MGAKVKPGSPSVAERVTIIADLMRNLEWNRKAMNRLAEEWGVQPGTVRDASATAHHLVLHEVKDKDGLVRDVGCALRLAIVEARAVGEYSAMVKACETLTKIMGVQAPTEVDVNHRIAGLSPENLDRLEKSGTEVEIAEVLEAMLVDVREAKALPAPAAPDPTTVDLEDLPPLPLH